VSSSLEPYYWHHPVSEIEPSTAIDEIHDARLQCVRILNGFAAELEAVLSRKNSTVQDVAVRMYGMAYALGLGCVSGVPMLDRAVELGCTRQALSKIAVSFCLSFGLSPSFAQKSLQARQSYRKSRINSVCRSRAKP
jgi:hypothetical protein